jgi:hypothetical protein
MDQRSDGQDSRHQDGFPGIGSGAEVSDLWAYLKPFGVNGETK